jgi:hypothetical protein
MERPQKIALHLTVQKAIDLIARGELNEAAPVLADARELLEELLDFADDDAELVELGKYGVLLEQLGKRVGG